MGKTWKDHPAAKMQRQAQGQRYVAVPYQRPTTWGEDSQER